MIIVVDFLKIIDIVVNDRTGEVVQVSDKTDPKWVDDSRIQWEKK